MCHKSAFPPRNDTGLDDFEEKMQDNAYSSEEAKCCFQPITVATHDVHEMQWLLGRQLLGYRTITITTRILLHVRQLMLHKALELTSKLHILDRLAVPMSFYIISLNENSPFTRAFVMKAIRNEAWCEIKVERDELCDSYTADLIQSLVEEDKKHVPLQDSPSSEQSLY